MVSRAVNISAVKTATENKAATNSVQSDVAREAVYSAAHSDSSSTIHSAAQGRSGTNGNNSGSMNTVGGMSTSVPGMENPIVRNGGDSNTVISTPGEVPAMPGDTSPLPSAIPAGGADPITMNEAEDRGEIHPIPPSDPGITIQAAPVGATEISESTVNMSSAPVSPSVDTISGSAESIPSAPDSIGGEVVSIPSTPSMPQTISQDSPGISLTSAEPQSGGTMETAMPSVETPMPPAPAEGGIGVPVSTVSETDASTVNSSTSENVSVPISSSPANTVKSPGESSPGTQVVPPPAGGTVLHTDSQQRTVSGSSKETSSQTTRTAHTTQATHSSSAQSTIQTERVQGYGLGGAMFMRSLASGGSFANNIIGSVATGNVQTSGTISGDMASQALTSYMGHTAIGSPPATTPTYTDVEIGGGRITGIETAPGGQSIQFSMYHTDQFNAPKGDYTKVVSADGATWDKQYAQDTVERKPYKAPDNTVAYHETIVKRMPDPPRRKDKT